MTCNIAATPFDIEPLPLYRRDPETSSLLSFAPSYTSEAPTYHSSVRDSGHIIIPEPARRQQQQQQPPYYVSTSLLDISTPPPTRPRNNTTTSTTAIEPPASTVNDAHQRAISYCPDGGGGGGLPSPAYAPGFTSRASPDADAFALQNGYNIGAFSSVTGSSHARRQYERVAMRRASRAAGIDRTTALLESMKMGAGGNGNGTSGGENPPASSAAGGGSAGGSSRAATPPPPPLTTMQGQTGGGGVVGDGGGGSEVGERLVFSAPEVVGSAAAAAVVVAIDTASSSLSASAPVLPHEDPALVGDAAAKKAREQRLYREACLRRDGDARLVQESKSWDFMLSQMADWEERERSWGRFRSEVEARQSRIGAMNIGIGRLGGFAIGDGTRVRSRRWPLGRTKIGSR